MFGKKKEMTDSEKKAKLSALGEAHNMASDMLKGKLGGLKKVTVASDSKEGLKKGLDKAEDIVSGEDKPLSPFQNDEEESTEQEDSASEEAFEDSADTALEQCDTEEEIDDLIAKLQEKKKQLQS